MLNEGTLSSGSVLANVTPLVAGGTESKRGAPCSARHAQDINTATTIPRRIRTMPQDSASRALSLVAALVVATGATGATACRSKPIDRRARLTAHYLGRTDLGRLPVDRLRST